MLDSVTESEIGYEFSKKIVFCRISKLSTTRPDIVVIASRQSGFIAQITDGGMIRFKAFVNP